MSTFDSLPPELMDKIISFLPCSKLDNIRLVSKRFKEICDVRLRIISKKILEDLNDLSHKLVSKIPENDKYIFYHLYVHNTIIKYRYRLDTHKIIPPYMLDFAQSIISETQSYMCVVM